MLPERNEGAPLSMPYAVDSQSGEPTISSLMANGYSIRKNPVR